MATRRNDPALGKAAKWRGHFGLGTGPVPLEGPPIVMVQPPSNQKPRYAPHAKPNRKEKP